MTLVISEKIISSIVGKAIPKPANDQNTDDIMPARFLKEITFKNMGSYVYADERVKDGMKVINHPFNDPKYTGANILVAGANYGCGSSREHAPQGLLRYGIKAIVAESFAEIFAGNCAAIGIVPVTADRNSISELVEIVKDTPGSELFLDLDKKRLKLVVTSGTHISEYPIDLPEGRRQAFLNGTWDAMAVLQQNQEQAESVRKSLPYMSL